MRFFFSIILILNASLATASELSFTVIGIDCSACAKPVVKTLSSIDGVKNVRLDWHTATAQVEVPPGFDRSRIRTALNNAGFEVAFRGEKIKAMEPLPPEVVRTLDIASNPGTSKIDFNSILAPGKITIVDFYADWCGPCHVLEARLQHFMQERPGIALRRVNIGKWDNQAAKQATREFRAEALPYLRIYDRNGKFVASVTGSMWDEVLAAVERAQK